MRDLPDSPMQAPSEHSAFSRSCRLPARAGIGFKPEHFEGLAGAQRAGFLEVHAENYMSEGGPSHRQLEHLRRDYPLSIHGVGLSIGGEGQLDREHLARLKKLIARYQPTSFSEHLAWSSHGPYFFNDLFPIAYDDATLSRVCDHIDEVQSALGWRMLLENPSTYLEFASSTYSEIDFVRAIAARTGCGLLLDVNNVSVSCANHGRDPLAYIDDFPVEAVGEIHLAGYAEETDSLGAPLRIDAHGSAVEADVWMLYRHTLKRTGGQPTLIEWDNDIPTLDILLAEAKKAETFLAAAPMKVAA